jgi:hypothetical protein
MPKSYFEKFAKLAADKDKIRKSQAKADKERSKIEKMREEWEANLPEKTRRVRAANKAKGYEDGGVVDAKEAKMCALKKLIGKK